MRVYHYINKDYGLMDLELRRLKIATFYDLNDPFELFSFNMSDKNVRRRLRYFKDELSSKRGILCFSETWQSCVMWSHYADGHRGLCLGFDASDDRLEGVSYIPKRLAVDSLMLDTSADLSKDDAKKLLFTKYYRWHYEKEHRIYARLDKRDPATGCYFADFSEQLQLKSVIVGAESEVSRGEIESALGELAATVNVFKARLSFARFLVVKQKNQRLWS